MVFRPLLAYYFGGSILKSPSWDLLNLLPAFMVSFQPCSKQWERTCNTNRISENSTYISGTKCKEETDVGDLKVDKNMILKWI
jgi:hypothetical protein